MNIVTNLKKNGISADTLKWIALITMLIDHTGASILEKIPHKVLCGIFYCRNSASDGGAVVSQTGRVFV